VWVLIGVILGSALALGAPDAVLWLKPALQPAFAVTMLCVGTLVRPEQLRAFLESPWRPVAGLFAQYTIMPLTAAAISLAFDDPLVRTGIILVGCTPGAMASNVMTVLLRGDVVLSVAMTTGATLLCPLMIGGWLRLLADERIEVPVAAMVWNALWMVVAPVATGIAVRGLGPRLPARWDRAATWVASLAIVIVLLVVVAVNRGQLASLSLGLAIAMLGLNLSAYALAFGAATAMRWPAAQRRTLVIEVGMQNAGLGSVLALTHLGEAAAVPSAFYTALCIATAAVALPFAPRT
jgi:BASS family bile acid:Na+ symporter